MTSDRPKRRICGDAGGVSKSGQPCRSVWIDRATHLCGSHDPNQVNTIQESRKLGGRKSRSSRLSKRMTRLVQMLFSDASMAPTLERIEPREFNEASTRVHLLKIEGQRAVLDGHGPNGLMCFNHYRCTDDSMFARAMRLLRICEGKPESDEKPTYFHLDTGTIIPQSEIDKIVKLERERE